MVRSKLALETTGDLEDSFPSSYSRSLLDDFHRRTLCPMPNSGTNTVTDYLDIGPVSSRKLQGLRE